MGKLKFQSLMSGTRITTDEKIGELPWVMEYKDTPEFIRKMYWWALACISIEFQGWNEKVARSMFNNDEILTNVNISQEAMDKAYIKISGDDQRTYWVYLNRKDLWAELVEYFGSDESVFKNYIRWFH